MLKQLWMGTLVFAVVGVAGYLSVTRLGGIAPAEFAKRPAEAVSGSVASPGSVLEPPRPGLMDLPFANQTDAREPPSGSVKGSLESQLGGDSVPVPPKATPEQLAAQDRQCRERMQKFGVVVANGPCADLGAIVDNLATGGYKFNKPSRANVGEAFDFRLIVQTAEDQAANFDGTQGPIVTRMGKLAQSVDATLSGDGFEISPAGPQARTMTRSEPVEWDWKVTPTSPGTKTLNIEVAANIEVGPDKHRVQIKTLHETIEIQVTLFQRLKTYVADANGFVIAAAALVPSLAVLIGLVPKVRNFIREDVLRLRRRRPNRAARS